MYLATNCTNTADFEKVGSWVKLTRKSHAQVEHGGFFPLVSGLFGLFAVVKARKFKLSFLNVQMSRKKSGQV